MINTDALSLACKHLNSELREREINKLQRQKHAAHQNNHRLNTRLKKLEITNEILNICILLVTKKNNILTDLIIKFSNEINSE